MGKGKYKYLIIATLLNRPASRKDQVAYIVRADHQGEALGYAMAKWYNEYPTTGYALCPMVFEMVGDNLFDMCKEEDIEKRNELLLSEGNKE